METVAEAVQTPELPCCEAIKHGKDVSFEAMCLRCLNARAVVYKDLIDSLEQKPYRVSGTWLLHERLKTIQNLINKKEAGLI